MKHPWRATLRTTLAALVGLLPVLPHIVNALGAGSIPWVAATVTISAGITRILALPEMERWLDRYAPWLTPEPYEGKHRKTTGENEDEN
ncbi:hypothetical protein ACOI9H_01710 [Corynebacterium striatum]|uniref:hypothetical protein n=1 Tax=Corynebacterium striatum TaxID=43770 RepID=UPI003B598472